MSVSVMVSEVYVGFYRCLWVSGCHGCLLVFIGVMSGDGCQRVSMGFFSKNFQTFWVIFN